MSRSRSASPSSPNKRARVAAGEPGALEMASGSNGEGESSSRAALTLDADFWLEDGNIVVVAENSAFRVHKSVLARRSEVFSGLFAVPQPENEADVEKVHGCPLVRVQDSAHDFKHFLRALYDGIEWGAQYTQGDSEEPKVQFSALAALLRLSHKYEVTHIREAAVQRLKPVFTNNFATWTAFEAQTKRYPVDIAPGEHIEAFNLLRACGYDEMLPVALHMCTKLDTHLLLHGATRADGTRETLAMDDLERCLVARTELEARSAAFNHYIKDFAHHRRPRCTGNQNQRCPEAFSLAWTVAAGAREANGASGEIGRRRLFVRYLRLQAISVQNTPNARRICDVCLGHITSNEQQFVRKMWDDLPTIMGLQVSQGPPGAAAP